VAGYRQADTFFVVVVEGIDQPAADFGGGFEKRLGLRLADLVDVFTRQDLDEAAITLAT
jgi:hypothetical protein